MGCRFRVMTVRASRARSVTAERFRRPPRIKDVKRLALLLLLAVTLPAAATEICRFQALDAENPFQRWLGSQEVACVDAGSPLAFPAGTWNVFARADWGGSIDPMLGEGGGAPIDRKSTRLNSRH